MRAQAGDRLIIRGHRIHEPDRDAEILEVRGDGGEPPYLVRWSDDGHETLIYPGVDAQVESLAGRKQRLDGEVSGQGKHARDLFGAPTLSAARAVGLVRRHLEIEKIRSDAYDSELWTMWQQEVERGDANDHNAAVLDRVLERLRVGG